MEVKIHWSHVRVILGQPIFVMINGEKMSSNKCYFTNLEKVERYPDPEINRIAIGQVDGNKVVIGFDFSQDLRLLWQDRRTFMRCLS